MACAPFSIARTDAFTGLGEVGDGLEGVRLAQTLVPQVILMDVQRPMLDGLQATARIRELGLASRVLILTTFYNEEYVLDGIRARASGYLLKNVRLQELFDAMRRVAAGEIFISPAWPASTCNCGRRVGAGAGAGDALDALHPVPPHLAAMPSGGAGDRRVPPTDLGVGRSPPSA